VCRRPGANARGGDEADDAAAAPEEEEEEEEEEEAPTPRLDGARASLLDDFARALTADPRAGTAYLARFVEAGYSEAQFQHAAMVVAYVAFASRCAVTLPRSSGGTSSPRDATSAATSTNHHEREPRGISTVLAETLSSSSTARAAGRC